MLPVKSSAYLGSYSQSPFCSETANLTEISINIEGINHPQTALTLNPGDDDNVRTYWSMLEAADWINSKGERCTVDYEKFVGGKYYFSSVYAIFSMLFI